MKDKRFFCLRGFMKSGTNWLGSLLSSHQEIDVVGEFHFEYMADPMLENFGVQPVYSEPGAAEYVRKRFENMVRQSLAFVADNTATVIGERTPHTLAPIVLRNSPHISIVRDGRDVLVSRAFHLFNMPAVHRLFKRIPAMARDHEKFQADPWYFKNNPDQLLRHETMVRESVQWWREHLEQDRETLEQHPELKHAQVRYEDLHRDVSAERRRLFEFLGVDPDNAAQIEGHLTPGFEKERPTEFFRKGKVGDWKNYFTDKTKQWFKDAVQDELQLQGYVDSDSW